MPVTAIKVKGYIGPRRPRQVLNRGRILERLLNQSNLIGKDRDNLGLRLL